MGKCDEDTNKANKVKAKNKGHRDTFATVTVKIVERNGDTVHFIPKGQTTPVITEWTDANKNAWPECPTEVVAKGDKGLAMIGGDAYAAMSPAAQNIAGRPKWPDAEPLDARKRSEIPQALRLPLYERPDPRARWGYTDGHLTITSMRVKGVIDGGTDVTEHELIIPGLPPVFDLDLSGFDSLVTIAVDGRAQEVTMQVLNVHVSGRGEVERSNVDLMDPLLAYPYQIIRVRGDNADVTLSQKGCALFGVAFDP